MGAMEIRMNDDYRQELMDDLTDLAQVLKVLGKNADSLTCTKAAIWISGTPRPEELELPNAIWLAKFIHDAYERMAPQYGYATREDTRVFDHESPNGRLMAAVCEELRGALLPPLSEGANDVYRA